MHAQCLPSRRKAPGLIPSIAKTNQKRRNFRWCFIMGLKRPKQEDHEFKSSLSYIEFLAYLDYRVRS